MAAKIIDGQAIANQIQEEIKEKVAARAAAGKPVPGLATVLVGGDPASAMYVKMKQKRCAKRGDRILPRRTAGRYLSGRA